LRLGPSCAETEICRGSSLHAFGAPFLHAFGTPFLHAFGMTQRENEVDFASVGGRLVGLCVRQAKALICCG
jgi:hypothetical protein